MNDIPTFADFSLYTKTLALVYSFLRKCVKYVVYPKPYAKMYINW